MGIYIYAYPVHTIYIYCSIQAMTLNTYFTFNLTSGNKRKQTSDCVCVWTNKCVVLCFEHATSSLNHAGYMQATKASLDRWMELMQGLLLLITSVE